jgi:hypothetical protein
MSENTERAYRADCAICSAFLAEHGLTLERAAVLRLLRSEFSRGKALSGMLRRAAAVNRQLRIMGLPLLKGWLPWEQFVRSARNRARPRIPRYRCAPEQFHRLMAIADTRERAILAAMWYDEKTRAAVTRMKVGAPTSVHSTPFIAAWVKQHRLKNGDPLFREVRKGGAIMPVGMSPSGRGIADWIIRELVERAGLPPEVTCDSIRLGHKAQRGLL